MRFIAIWPARLSHCGPRIVAGTSSKRPPRTAPPGAPPGLCRYWRQSSLLSFPLAGIAQLAALRPLARREPFGGGGIRWVVIAVPAPVPRVASIRVDMWACRLSPRLAFSAVAKAIAAQLRLVCYRCTLPPRPQTCKDCWRSGGLDFRLSSSFGGDGTGRIARLSRRFVPAGRSRLLCTV